MNVVFFQNITGHNGWRWRLEIHTADEAVLSSPEYVRLPDKVLGNEITWQAKFEKMPLGLSETPSLTLTFNVRNLGTSPELAHLRNRLFKPFVRFDLPPNTYTTANDWGWDAELGQWLPIGGQTITEPARIPTVNLSNVVRLRCDFGNQNDTTFFTRPIENADSENGSLVFSGVQRISPEPEYDLTTGALTIEFMHLSRFCLEQVNYTVVQNYFLRNTITKTRTGYVLVATQTSGGQTLELRESIVGATESSAFGQYEGIELAKIEDLFACIQEPFEIVRNKVLRVASSTFYDLPLGYIEFSRFYRQIGSGVQGTTLSTANLMFVSRIFDAYNDDNGNRPVIGGTFSESSAFAKYKNMFDFLLDFYNSGNKVTYRDTLFRNGNLQQGLEIGSTPDLTKETIELTTLTAQADCIASVEVVAGGKNTILGNFGTALVDTTANVFTYFHTGYAKWEFAESLAENNTFIGEITVPVIDAYSFNLAAPEYEGRLCYLDGLVAKMVHPACDYADNGTFQNDGFVAGSSIPVNTVTIARKRDWEAVQISVNNYLEFWASDFGIANHVGRAILRHFTFDEQKKIDGKTRVQGLYSGGGGSTNINSPMPVNLGYNYNRDADLLETFTNTPTARQFLSSCSMNVLTGVCECSFHALPNPITITPL